jgi:hypothetical protein
MKKTNFFKFLLVGAFALSLGFVGCKNYDDDIKKLNERVDLAVKNIEEVKATLRSMTSIESVTKGEDGKTLTIVYWKDGKKETIEFVDTNTQDGVGTIITKEDGYWKFGDEKTAYKVVPDTSTGGDPVVVNLPYIDEEDGYWYFYEGDDYVKSDYFGAGAYCTVEGPDSWIIYVWNKTAGSYEAIPVSKANGSSSGVAVSKIDVLGWIDEFKSTDLPGMDDMGDFEVSVDYAYFDGFSAGSGQTADFTSYVWAGSSVVKGDVVLASKGGFIVQTNPGADLGNVEFALMNTAGEELEQLAFGTPVAITGAMKSTRAASAGGMFFVPVKNPATLPHYADQAALDAGYLSGDYVYALVANGAYYSSFSITVEPGSSDASALTSNPGEEAASFVLEVEDDEDAPYAITVAGEFAEANSGVDYMLALDAENTTVKNIVDFYLEWDGVAVPSGEVEILDQIGTPSTTSVKGRGFSITMTDAVEELNYTFALYALGADGKVYEDELDITVIPAKLPDTEFAAVASYTIEEGAAWENEEGKRLMPTIEIDLATMFTQMDAKGTYASDVTFSEFWQSADGPDAVTLKSVALAGTPGNTDLSWSASAGGVMNAATGYSLVAKKADAAVAAGKVYEATKLSLTLPSSYSTDGETPTFNGDNLGKEHIFTFEFTKGAGVDQKTINTVTMKFTPVLPAVTITEAPYTKNALSWVNDVLIAYLSGTEGTGNDKVSTYSLVMPGPGVTNSPFATMDANAEFAITYPYEYFTVGTDQVTLTEATSATGYAASDYVTLVGNKFSLKRQVPVVSVEAATDVVEAAAIASVPVTTVLGGGLVESDLGTIDLDGDTGTDMDLSAKTISEIRALITASSSDATAKSNAETALKAEILAYAIATDIPGSDPVVTYYAQAEADADKKATEDYAKASKVWDAYGKELKVTPSNLTYMVAYPVNKNELDGQSYRIKMLSPLDVENALVVKTDGIKLQINKADNQITKDDIWAKDYTGTKYDLFASVTDAVSNANLENVEFFVPSGAQGYTLVGADSKGVVAAGDAVTVNVNALPQEGSTTLGVRITDKFGRPIERTINVQLVFAN